MSLILTHGANSLHKQDLTDFLVLSYGQLDANNDIICNVGAATLADNTELESAGIIETQFGSMNFLKRNSTVESNTLQFFNNDITTEWLKSNAYQVECICRLDTRYNFYKFMYGPISQDYFQRNQESGEVNVLASVIQSKKTYTTDRYNDSLQSDYYYSSGGIGNYFTKAKTKHYNLTSEFHHICCTIDFPNKQILAWIDGILCWVIHIDDYLINWYTTISCDLYFKICSGDRISQMCIRKAVWTEPINYTPPSEPYVK